MRSTLEKIFYIILIVSAILGLPVFAYQTFVTQRDFDAYKGDVIQRLDRFENKFDAFVLSQNPRHRGE